MLDWLVQINNLTFIHHFRPSCTMRVTWTMGLHCLDHNTRKAAPPGSSGVPSSCSTSSSGGLLRTANTCTQRQRQWCRSVVMSPVQHGNCQRKWLLVSDGKNKHDGWSGKISSDIFQFSILFLLYIYNISSSTHQGFGVSVWVSLGLWKSGSAVPSCQELCRCCLLIIKGGKQCQRNRGDPSSSTAFKVELI